MFKNLLKCKTKTVSSKFNRCGGWDLNPRRPTPADIPYALPIWVYLESAPINQATAPPQAYYSNIILLYNFILIIIAGLDLSPFLYILHVLISREHI